MIDGMNLAAVDWLHYDGMNYGIYGVQLQQYLHVLMSVWYLHYLYVCSAYHEVNLGLMWHYYKHGMSRCGEG